MLNLSSEIKNFFFKLLLPNVKPIVAGIIYGPPSQSDILEIINTHFSKLDAVNNEVYILGDLNINLCLEGYLCYKAITIQNVSSEAQIKNFFIL